MSEPLSDAARVDYSSSGQNVNLFWRDYIGGDNVMWFMGGSDNATVIASLLLPFVSPNWDMEGITDFNRDGQADLFWRDYVTGTNIIWFTGDNTQIASWVELPTISTNWRVEGMADFNRDGRSDIVWRDYFTGENVVWFMGGSNGTTITSWTSLPTVSTNWSIEGMADFNRDGRSDMVWRDYFTGENVVWFLGGSNGTTITSWTYLLPVAVNWEVTPFNAA